MRADVPEKTKFYFHVLFSPESGGRIILKIADTLYIITQSHKPEDDSINLHLQNTSFLAVRNETKVHTKAVH